MNPAEDLLAIHLDELRVEYETQFRYALPRKHRADFALLDARVLIEVVGGVYDQRAHGSVTGVLKDIERLNLATINGWRMLRVTPQMVEDETAKALVLRVTTPAPKRLQPRPYDQQPEVTR